MIASLRIREGGNRHGWNVTPFIGGTLKSHVSILTEAASCIINDAGAKCGANQLTRDLKTLESRIKHEGLSFLTITLPAFGKDFERCLSLGRIDSTLFRSFKKRAKAPAFLQGFFSRVFDISTGGILDDPDVAAIEGIRQIAYTFKKLEIDCTPKRVRKALEGFKQDELVFEEAIPDDDVNYFINVSRCLWDSIIGGDSSLAPFEMIPKHGPGATQEGASGNQKYRHYVWHDRLENYFPLLHTAFSNEGCLDHEDFQCVKVVSKEFEKPVRVITVPKTLKAPRIIAIEPVCQQYAQQAVAHALINVLERSPLTSGHLNFRNQEVNQRLALIASASEGYATLDLSSASDRVPYSLAIRMFDSNPDLQGAISACRSTRAKLPTGEIIHLKKFASMGSALCFPVEAMYFYTICVAALLRGYNLPVTYHNALRVSRYVYVYGDDIIVPSTYAPVVVDYLHKYYCKVGVDKSFWTGKFRESCGTDAYAGEVVTPTYIKQMPPDDKRHAKRLISWVKTSNLLYKRGYWRTSAFLIKKVEAILGELPILSPNAAGLGKVSFQHFVSIQGWSKDHQAPVVRAWCSCPVYQEDKLEGHGALLKCLLKLEEKPRGSVFKHEPSDGKHLERSARHGTATLKRRWISPY